MTSSFRQPRRAVQAVLLMLVAAYAPIDFLTPAVFEHRGLDWAVLGALATGAMLGQAGVLTIWAAVGPLPLWIRWG